MRQLAVLCKVYFVCNYNTWATQVGNTVVVYYDPRCVTGACEREHKLILRIHNCHGLISMWNCTQY